MFWNDPNMYGMTFPYKDFPTPLQTPFAGPVYPWQSLPRFVPPTLGLPTYYGMTPMAIDPFVHTRAIDPFLYTRPIDPFLHTRPVDPFLHTSSIYREPLHLNLPFYNWYRPFAY